MFGKPLSTDFPKTAELVGVCDSNPLRARAFAAELPKPVPVFEDFKAMLRDADPEAVIVATRDCFHADYIIATLEAGLRAISEKPLCTTAEQCRAILAAAKKSAGRCLVTHNARYSAAETEIRRVLKSGKLGRPLFMQFDETLDRCHGADYFRRWHRHKANSGGLLIHKASHHFDCLNWWAGSKPARVSAQGRLVFYGANGPYRGPRCCACPHAGKCRFYEDLFERDVYRKLYRESEPADGYIRDGCVYDKAIDIEDQMGVLIGYENGIQVSYTLTAYSPYESQRVIIECERGRIEYFARIDTGWAGTGFGLPGIEKLAGEELKLYVAGKGVRKLSLKRVKGSHGGADPQLRADFFGRSWDRPLTERMAPLEEAVQAVLIGAAANQSIATGKPVDVQALLKG
jgi:predicted dehydrogenase